MSRSVRFSLTIALSIAVVAAGAVVGFRWWKLRENRTTVVSNLPRQPALDRAPAELKSRIVQAEDEARHGSNPIEALKTLSRLYDANGYAEKAIKCYAALSRLEPTQPRWFHLRATLLAGYGRLEEAVPLWQQTLALESDYLPARIRLADALLMLNRTEEATNTYHDVLSRHDAAKGRAPDVPDPWVHELLEDCYDPYKLRVAAAVLENSGDVPRAKAILEHVLKIVPDDAAAQRELGRMLLAEGNVTEARRCLERAVRLAPTESDNWIGLFKIAMAARDNSAAKGAILAGLSHCPNSPALHLEQGRILLADHNADGALSEFAVARQLRPNDPDVIVQIGIAHLYQGKNAEGIADMLDVLRVQPDHPLALLTLARVAIDAGKPGDASQLIQRLRQQNRTRPEDIQEISAMFQQRFGSAP